jgi:uncharacterized protein
VRGDTKFFCGATQGSCGIAIMAKASYPGRTKTRLVPPLTFGEAAAFNTAFLRDVAANIAVADRDARRRGARLVGYIAFGPPRSEPFFREILPISVGLIEVWHLNFGDCLFAAVEKLLTLGHNGAVVLNSDSPTLPTALLVEAAEVLARSGDRAVLGPSTDGGYYLLGLKKPHRRLFEDVAWSTESVARQTLDRAAEIGLAVHMLPSWYDVDDIAALRLLQSELYAGVSFAPALTAHHAMHARQLFDVLLRETDLAQRLGGEPGAREAADFANPFLQRAAE